MMALCRRPAKNKQRKRKQRMTSNRAFAIRLVSSTNPVVIETHYTPAGQLRDRPITIVSHLIQGILTFPLASVNSAALLICYHTAACLAYGIADYGNYFLKKSDGTPLSAKTLLTSLHIGDDDLILESNIPGNLSLPSFLFSRDFSIFICLRAHN